MLRHTQRGATYRLPNEWPKGAEVSPLQIAYNESMRYLQQYEDRAEDELYGRAKTRPCTEDKS